MEYALKLLEAFARLLDVLVWPALILFIMLRFHQAISDFLGSVIEPTFKGAGFEAKLKMAEAAAALAAAGISKFDSWLVDRECFGWMTDLKTISLNVVLLKRLG
jgi:hypothetical protein